MNRRKTAALSQATLSQRREMETTDDPARGLRYWLPVDMVVVDVIVTITSTREIVERDHTLVPVEDITVERNGILSLRTIADSRTEAQIIDIPKSVLRDSSIGVEVTSGGLLRSVSPSSVGRVGQIIVAIAKFAGRVGPFFPRVAIKTNKMRPIRRSQGCNPFEPPLVSEPVRVRALAQESPKACSVVGDILVRQDALRTHENTRVKLDLDLETAPPADIPALKQRLSDAKAAIVATTKELDAKQAILAGLLEAFATKHKLGKTARTEVFTAVFSLDDIPKTPGAVQPGSVMADFFARSGVLVTGGPLPEAAVANKRSAAPRGNGDIRIAFRQAAPWRFRIDQKKQSADGRANHRSIDSTDVEFLTHEMTDVIARNSPIRHIDFESSALAERALVVLFDERGRPVRFERAGTSAGAALATAVADAMHTARDEYATGLAKLIDIQSSEQKLRLNDISNQIGELTKRKDLLDAQLSLGGATATMNAVLERQRLQSEIALLQVRQQQQIAASTADQTVEIESLKVQLEQLKAQLGVLKAQAELKRLRQED